MNPSQHPIARALDALDEERAHLTARLAKVDALIAQLRDVFHLPKVSAGAAPAKAVRPPKKATAGRDDVRDPERAAREGKYDAAIRKALAKGPMSSGDLARAVGLEVPALRYHCKALVSAGAIILTGATSTRRIALAAAPKEAP